MARFTSVTAQKGDVVSLNKVTQSEQPLKSIHVGLGWDVHDDVNADLDAFIVQLDEQDRLIDTVYFNHLKSHDNAILHTGDNLTGEGEGDDEVILIQLDKLDPRTHRLVIAVNIYQCRLTFNEIENAFVRVLDKKTGDLIVRYDLSYEFGKNYSMLVGEILKSSDGAWDFKAVGIPTTDRTYKEVERRVSNGDAPPFPSTSTTSSKKSFISRFLGR